ncbi:MAG: GspE/PulE family protein, partial [Planctomycetia bacterium]
PTPTAADAAPSPPSVDPPRPDPTPATVVTPPAADEDEKPSEIVDAVLHAAVAARATDVHFDPQPDGSIRVRFRVDGQLRDARAVPARLAAPLFSRIKILAQLDIIERRDAQDGNFVYHTTLNGAPADRSVRIATVPTRHGERLVARLLDHDAFQLGLDGLGMDPPQVAMMERLLRRPYGIWIVTGPVGSGKTTTLYSCLQRLHSPHRNLMTVEDPVEHPLAGVNQLQVDPRLDWTFPKALRALLRQDPDVLMIGEVRDDETARIAVRASLTGVLVLTSMHANDAPSAVGNLYNFGIPPYLLSASLLGVAAQRLVRRLNPATAEEYTPDDETRRLLKLAPDALPDLRLRRPKRTLGDLASGYHGRTGVYEVMEIDDRLRELVARQAPKDELHAQAVAAGMTTLAAAAAAKVLAGATSVEEMLRVVFL